MTRYEIMLEDHNTKDTQILETKNIELAKKLFIENMNKYRVAIRKVDDDTATVILDNFDYWELINK